MEDDKTMSPEERKDLFQKELAELMSKHSIDIYPANVVMPSGEVMPMIKMADTQEDELMATNEAPKEDEDKTKK